jgi:hypothetical protein
MPTPLDAVLQSILRQEAEDRPAADARVEAAMADPVLRGIIDRATQRYAGLFSEKGMERARRTLAVYFTTDPRGVAALAKMKKQVASGEVPADRRQTPVAPTEQRRKKP